MLYRVRADLVFNIEDEGTDFLHDCLIAIRKAVPINPGAPNYEETYISLEKCFHDEDPTHPCELLEKHIVP